VKIKKDTDWLWCLHCEKFFQAKDLCIDTVGLKQGCPNIESCGGSGFDVDIFPWDDWPKQNPDLWERWPKSETELELGMCCPLYLNRKTGKIK